MFFWDFAKLADLAEKAVIKAFVISTEFQKYVAEQSTFDVLLFSTEAPGIEGYAVDAVRACTSGLIFARVVLEVLDVELFDSAFSGTPSTQKADTKRRVVLI